MAKLTIFSWICFKGEGGGAGFGRDLPLSWRRAGTCSVCNVFCANFVILAGKKEDVGGADDDGNDDDDDDDDDDDEFVA